MLRTKAVSSKTGTVHQYRITLRGIEPRIWRRIQVPSTYTFWDLHVAIQDAMGWLDYHLHRFLVRAARTVEIGIPTDDPYFPPERETLAGWEVRMTEYFRAPGDGACYEYDFGDGWAHDVLLEAVVERHARHRYPLCVDGERACPPEDCGGVRGYEELLETLADPWHERYSDVIDWLGGRFDPEAFQPHKVRFDNPRKRWRLAFEEA